MKRLLVFVGAATLLLWTGLGLLAWSSVGRRITVITAEQEATGDAQVRLAAFEDELGALHQDVRALAVALGENLQALHDALLIGQEEHAVATQLQVAALRDEVGSLSGSPSSGELADLRREFRELCEALRASTAPDSASQLALVPLAPADEAREREALEVASATPRPEPEPLPLDAPAEPASANQGPRTRKSFLAFKLPSDDFRFDERRSWTILPALSRVGFDAKTTLHDFSATTSDLVGQLEADLSRPADSPAARVSVRAASLVSGDTDRDEAMREHLAVERFATLDFVLTGFESGVIDLARQSATGTALGRLTIRGVTQDVRMPVRIGLDGSRRLSVDGESLLDLTRFEVPVPNKLGLITMEKDVEVWISLRLRVEPRDGL